MEGTEERIVVGSMQPCRAMIYRSTAEPSKTQSVLRTQSRMPAWPTCAGLDRVSKATANTARLGMGHAGITACQQPVCHLQHSQALHAKLLLL